MARRQLDATESMDVKSRGQKGPCQRKKNGAIIATSRLSDLCLHHIGEVKLTSWDLPPLLCLLALLCGHPASGS